MTDGIDLARVIWQNSPNVADWPATIDLQGVEFKPGTPSDGNCGVRPIFNRAAVNVRWPDVRVWTHNPETGKPNDPTDGWIQFTLWAFVKVGNRWYGAALHEFWSDRFGQARVWTGAPILTQWGDWVYRNQWGPEMQSYRPQAGDEIGFMLTAGDRRSPHNLGDVRERTNVIRVRLSPAGVALPMDAPISSSPEPVPVVVVPPPPEPMSQPVDQSWKPALHEVEKAWAVSFSALSHRVTSLEDRLALAEADAAGLREQLAAIKVPTRGSVTFFGVKVPVTFG